MSKNVDADNLDCTQKDTVAEEKSNDDFRDIEDFGRDIKNTISSAGFATGISCQNIVDEVFKEFLVKKMEDIEGRNQKQIENESKLKVDMNKESDRNKEHKKSHKHKKKQKSKSDGKGHKSRSKSKDDSSQRSHRHHSKSKKHKSSKHKDLKVENDLNNIIDKATTKIGYTLNEETGSLVCNKGQVKELGETKDLERKKKEIEGKLIVVDDQISETSKKLEVEGSAAVHDRYSKSEENEVVGKLEDIKGYLVTEFSDHKYDKTKDFPTLLLSMENTGNDRKCELPPSNSEHTDLNLGQSCQEKTFDQKKLSESGDDKIPSSNKNKSSKSDKDKKHSFNKEKSSESNDGAKDYLDQVNLVKSNVSELIPSDDQNKTRESRKTLYSKSKCDDPAKTVSGKSPTSKTSSEQEKYGNVQGERCLGYVQIENVGVSDSKSLHLDLEAKSKRKRDQSVSKDYDKSAEHKKTSAERRSTDLDNKSSDRDRKTSVNRKSVDYSRKSNDHHKSSADRDCRSTEQGGGHSSRKRSHAKSDDSRGTSHSNHHKSKKPKHKRQHEKSLEIIDDIEMISPETHNELTERLLKRLNTSIKKGQEMKAEKTASLDSKHTSDESLVQQESGSKNSEVMQDVATLVAAESIDLLGSESDQGATCSATTGTVLLPSKDCNVDITNEAGKNSSKTGMGKSRKPVMKMGIRLSKTSVAIIASGVKVESQQDVTDCKDAGNMDSPAIGQVTVTQPVDDNTSNIPSLNVDHQANNTAKAEADKRAEKDGQLKQDPQSKRSSDRKDKSRSRSISKTKRRRHSKTRSRSRDGRKHSVRDLSESRSPKKRQRRSSRDKGRRSSRSRSISRSPRKQQRLSSRDKGRRSSRSRSRGRGKLSRSRSRDKSRRSRTRSRDRGQKSRSRSCDRVRRSGRDRSQRHQDSRFPSRSRSSESKKEDQQLKIDKAKLREIAMKNVFGNSQSGIGPAMNLKPDEVVAIKAGGKSVEELTDFCKRIAEKEKNQTGEKTPEKEKMLSDDEEKPFATNTFKARDTTTSIVLNIRNSKPLPVLTNQEKLAKAVELRTQFPVSSGSHHRAKEWVPVDNKSDGTGKSAVVLGKATDDDDKVFPDLPTEQIDVGQVVSERLSALKKLQSNPNDVQALGCVVKAQQQMQQWAASKQLPGQFIGSTGATVLSQRELMGNNPRNQAWVKKGRQE